MLLVALLALALGAQDAVAQLSNDANAEFSDSIESTPTLLSSGTRAVVPSSASAVSAPPSLSRVSVPSVASAPPNIVIATAEEAYHTYQGPYHTGSVATATAVAAAETTPYPSSGTSGAEVAAIVLGVICALQFILIAILALRSRNLARRATRLAGVLRDMPHPPASPPMATFTVPEALMKPMNVVHVAPPHAAATPVVRKLSRKAPPAYTEGVVDDAKVENVDQTYMA